MRTLRKTYTPTAVSTNGIVAAATGAASPLTLAASGAGDGLAHQLNLTSVSNISAITFTIVGKDADGQALTEAIAGPNATTVETTGYFLTVTSITISATLGASAVDIGWVDEFATPTIPLNVYADRASFEVRVTGTIDYTAQQTLSEIRTRADDGAFVWTGIPAGLTDNVDVIAVTATATWRMSPLPTGIRLIANSYSSSSALDLYIVHQNPI